MSRVEIHGFNHFIELLREEWDYAELLKMADDYIFEEAPIFHYHKKSEEFGLFFNFLNHQCPDRSMISSIISRLKEIKRISGHVSLEHLIYVLYTDQINALKSKFERSAISRSTFEDQLKKFNGGHFDLKRLISILNEE